MKTSKEEVTKSKVVSVEEKSQGAPQTIAELGEREISIKTNVILDSGSGCNIITVQCLKEIGIKMVVADTTNTVFTLGNGTQTCPIGKVEGILVNIKNVSRRITAYVLDHEKFKLLLGRTELQRFGIGVDFKKDDWWIYNEDGTATELSVSYGPTAEIMLTLKEVLYEEEVKEEIKENTELEETQVNKLKNVVGIRDMQLLIVN